MWAGVVVGLSPIRQQQALKSLIGDYGKTRKGERGGGEEQKKKKNNAMSKNGFQIFYTAYTKIQIIIVHSQKSTISSKQDQRKKKKGGKKQKQ